MEQNKLKTCWIVFSDVNRILHLRAITGELRKQGFEVLVIASPHLNGQDVMKDLNGSIVWADSESWLRRDKRGVKTDPHILIVTVNDKGDLGRDLAHRYRQSPHTVVIALGNNMGTNSWKSTRPTYLVVPNVDESREALGKWEGFSEEQIRIINRFDIEGFVTFTRQVL